MATKKPAPEKALAAMREERLDDLVDEIDAMTSAEVDAFVNANGGDAAGTRRRGQAQIEALREKNARMGDWQAAARAKRDAAEAAMANVRARRPKLPRAELEARIAAARSEARYAQPIASYYRKKTSGEPTDAELEALLDEIEALRELEDGASGKDGGEKDPK